MQITTQKTNLATLTAKKTELKSRISTAIKDINDLSAKMRKLKHHHNATELASMEHTLNFWLKDLRKMRDSYLPQAAKEEIRELDKKLSGYESQIEFSKSGLTVVFSQPVFHAHEPLVDKDAQKTESAVKKNKGRHDPPPFTYAQHTQR